MLAVVSDDIKKTLHQFLKYYGKFSIEQKSFSSIDADAVLLKIYHHNEDGSRKMLAMLVIDYNRQIVVRTREQYNSGISPLATQSSDVKYIFAPTTFTAYLKTTLLPHLV
jgi:hypothetical protein